MPRVAGAQPPTRRVAFLLVAGFALLGGLNGALLLLGVSAPIGDVRLADYHGSLMVIGFVGTVIALERASALDRTWGYLAPALTGVGAGTVVIGVAPRIGLGLMTAGMVALFAVYVPLWRRNEDPAAVMQAAGAFCAAGGSALLWAGQRVPETLPWLVGFVILTILGERMELSRITMTRHGLLLALSLVMLATIAVTLLAPDLGHRLLGVVLLVLVGWLLGNDVAMKTVRLKGLPRFIGVMLITGYLWLLVPAGVWLADGAVTSGFGYDAAVHGVFLGFTLAMILAHAPLILPAVLRMNLAFTAWFWGPAVLLEVSLVTRMVGDAVASITLVQVGGYLNVVAVLFFLVIAITHTSARRRLSP